MNEATEYERLEATGKIQRVRYPNVQVRLDGSIPAIIGRVANALGEAGVSDAEQERFFAAVHAAENYDAAILTVMEWVEVC